MGYLSIDNLYLNKEIMLFRKCYAQEKLHGSSGHISFDGNNKLTFYLGGAKHDEFIKLFDQDKLLEIFKENFNCPVTIYGEGIGGKMMGMSETYGPDLKFVAFDVRIGKSWLNTPSAEKVTKLFGIEFVDWKLIPTTLKAINRERDRESTQAVRNGMGGGKLREGIVLKSPIEVRKNNGMRVICKHKRDEFREIRTPRVISDEQLKVLTDANAIANEWVVPMRLQHVLQKATYDIDIKNMGLIIKQMIADIYTEGDKEITESKAVEKAIGRKTVFIFKKYLMDLK